MSLIVRPGTPDDFGFVLDAWRRSFEGSPAVRGADPNHYRLEMSVLIGELIKAGAAVLIACDETDPSAIAGFAVHTGHELHYVYVRGGDAERSLRGMGIARQLLEDLPIKAHTFRTDAFMRRIKPRERGWSFKPRFTL